MENETDRSIENGLRKLLISRLLICLVIGFSLGALITKVILEAKRYFFP